MKFDYTKLTPEKFKMLIEDIREIMSPDINYLELIVDEIFDSMDEKSKDLIWRLDSSDKMSQFHFSSGMATRNKYNLWDQKSPEHKWFKANLKIVHADDISGIILEALWYKVHNKIYDPAPTIEFYRKHWKEQGLNLDMTEINEDSQYLNSLDEFAKDFNESFKDTIDKI